MFARRVINAPRANLFLVALAFFHWQKEQQRAVASIATLLSQGEAWDEAGVLGVSSDTVLPQETKMRTINRSGPG
jgi:hypothetical protein